MADIYKVTGNHAACVAVFDLFMKDNTEVYLTGGTIRDVLLERTIGRDLDFVAEARPDTIKKILRASSGFSRVYKINKLETIEALHHETGAIIQITQMKKDEKGIYSLRKDLEDRDFTMNAMAFSPRTNIVDPFNGMNNLTHIKEIVTLNDNVFRKSPIRLLRMIRLSGSLHMKIALKTMDLAVESAHRILLAPAETCYSEMTKILMTDQGYVDYALEDLRDSHILNFILPEMVPMNTIKQVNLFHNETVWDHTKRVVNAINPLPLMRWAALLHDVAKPATHTISEGKDHFYRHDMLGERMIGEIAQRFKMSNNDTDRLKLLVKHHLRLHMYTSQWSNATVLRMDRELGPEVTDQLITLVIADIKGQRPECIEAGVQLISDFSKRLQDLRSGTGEVKLLPSGIGKRICQLLEIEAGPKVGFIKQCLSDMIKRDELPVGDTTGRYDEAIVEIYKELEPREKNK